MSAKPHRQGQGALSRFIVSNPFQDGQCLGVFDLSRTIPVGFNGAPKEYGY